jgi:hypothetical protein
MANEKRVFKQFISEEVTVQYASPPAQLKKPHCPDGFNLREEIFTITACLTEWQDFSRRGRLSKNMQPKHAEVASQRGSWGVGRFYFEVMTEGGRCFRLYYDRTPEDAADRSGHWILLAELGEEKA